MIRRTDAEWAQVLRLRYTPQNDRAAFRGSFSQLIPDSYLDATTANFQRPFGTYTADTPTLERQGA